MSGSERSSVQFGLTRISYAIRRSSRRGTVSVAVDPERGVLVTAPEVTPVERIDRVVKNKATWIVTRLRSRRVLAQPAPREFVSGETFKYLGRGYRLKVERGAVAVSRVALVDGRLKVEVARVSAASERASRVRAALMAWYRRHAEAHFQVAVARWAGRLEVAPAAVLIREAPKRWGSCDAKGNLRLNWRVVQASRRLIDYVVAHELMHLKHEHHSAAFWADLGRAMPDYEQRREELRRIGGTFVW